MENQHNGGFPIIYVIAGGAATVVVIVATPSMQLLSDKEKRQQTQLKISGTQGTTLNDFFRIFLKKG